MWTSSTRRGQLTLERRIIPASDGLIGLAQTFIGSDTRTLVTHEAFVLARVEVVEGKLSFPLSSGTVCAPDCFLLKIPPRSALPMAFDKACVRSEGVTGFSPLISNGIALLQCDKHTAPLDLIWARRAACASILAELNPDSEVSPVIVRARRILHELIAHPAPLRTAAKRVGIRPETLSRGFVRAYKLTPKQYCHRARLFEAVLRLMSGATILEAALAAGFQDLKRFYAQFRRLLGTTPGCYAQVKKRQDSNLNNRL
jgi:AraC-like DNA-binding protein